MVRLCRFVTEYEWLILGLMLPFVLFPSATRALVLLVIPVLWLVRRVATGHLVPQTPLDLTLLGLLFMVLVSEYATFDMANSLVKIAGLVYGIALFYAVVQWVGTSATRLWWGVAGLYATVLGLVAISLVLFGSPVALPPLTPLTARLPAAITAVADIGANPNEVAGLLLWLLPLALLLAGTAVSGFPSLAARFRWWGALPLVVALLGVAVGLSGVLLLTRSRAALGGVAAALIFMGLVGLTAVSRRLAVGVVLGFLSVLVVGVLLVGPEESAALFLAQAGIDNADPVSSLSGREEIWSRAIYGLQDFPFTGLGLNNFRKVVHILYPLFLISPDTDIGHAHNHWLQAGLDLGIPGLIAYLALWLGLAGLLWQSWRQAGKGWLRRLTVGFAGCLVAYFVYGLLDTIALGARPGFIFWGLVGLVAALHRVVCGVEG